MRLFRQSNELPAEFLHGAVAVGNFDGVHRGHAQLIERLLARAREVGGPAVVLTFDPHPVRILRPELAPPPLTWTERKVELLAELGVDVIIAYPTDDKLLKLSPAEFFQQIIREKLNARAIVEGPNFFFGHDRAGNIDVLRALCAESAIDLEIVEPLRLGDRFVSSSRVRDAIRQGHVEQAKEMLTHPYRIRGMVTHGAGRGAKIGFPTANLNAIDTLIPADGVYAGRAHTTTGAWPAAVNVGPNPTFGEQAHKVEVHLIDHHESLYGQPLEVDFIARLREIQTFRSVDELKAQLVCDVQAARAKWERWD